MFSRAEYLNVRTFIISYHHQEEDLNAYFKIKSV